MSKATMFGLAAVLLMLAAVTTIHAEEKKQVTVTGSVSLIDEDDADAGVKITDGDDEVYVVAMDKQGKELKKFVGKTVKATGTLGKNADDETTLTVKAFVEVKQEDEVGGEDW